MFDKVKQLNELRKMRGQAMELQRELEKIVKSSEKGRWKVTVNGAQQVIFITLDGEEQKELKELINQAVKDVQKDAAKKMMEMGGGLSGLLGKMGQ